MKHGHAKIPRPTTSKITNKIIPSHFIKSSSLTPESDDISGDLLLQKDSPVTTLNRRSKPKNGLSNLFRSVLNLITLPTILPTCTCLNIPNQLSITPSLGRKVTGTLFGRRRGHISFSVQDNPRSEPIFLIELAVSTATLVKEMSSGLVRIVLECQKGPVTGHSGRLFGEATWNMYCNGKKCGYAVSRACTESDWHVLSTVRSVSVGAGVIPVVDDGRKGGGSEGELLYMRAGFERVVGGRDSEAFYMMNPDGSGGPELSIFLLRI